MSVKVTIHDTQFPENLRGQLLDSLRSRQLNHKFHYQTYWQADKWRALHQTYAPNQGTQAAYDAAIQATVQSLQPAVVVGLCCGYAEKEMRLLQALQPTQFVACDTSLPIVLSAAQSAAKIIGENNCHRLLCDLQTATDLQNYFPPGPRLFTFFGSLHNFEPQKIFLRLAGLLQAGDHLLFSANLAPGSNLMRIVPQYDNAMTFDWAFQILADLGFSRGDGVFQVRVEPCPMDPNLFRISIYFVFETDRVLSLENDRIVFKTGESLRLFFSYRYTPAVILDHLERVRLHCAGQWISKNGEEGVFLTKKST
jgi:L-histidine Nalpha-methyltransferase